MHKLGQGENRKRIPAGFPIKTAIFFGLILFAGNIFQIPFSLYFLIFVVLIVSQFMPSAYSIQRVAISVVLVIGLTPFYFLIRGYLTESKLTALDLYIYGFLAIFISFITLGERSKLKNIFNLPKNQSKVFRQIAPSFLGLLFALLLEAYLLKKSLGSGVAWISSGDSKNHLVTSMDLVNYGDLLPSSFLTQPINAPSMLSLFFAQFGADLTLNPARLADFMVVYAFFWAMLIGLTGVGIAATAQVIAGRSNYVLSKLTISLLSLIPFFSLMVGPALNDGFFTAIFGITSLIVLTTWIIELDQSNNPLKIQLVTGFLLFLSTLMSWMFIAAVTFPILLLGISIYARQNSNKYFKTLLGIVGFLIFGVLVAHFTDFGQTFQAKIKSALTANGAVTSSNPAFYYALLCGLVVLGLSSRRHKTFGKLLVNLALLHIISLVSFKLFSNLGILSWNYYLLKYQWILTAALFAFACSFLFVEVDLSIKNYSKQKYIALGFMFIALYAVSESVLPYSVDKALPKIIRGWENPRSSIMDIALKQDLNNENPTMFFHYGYSGDARLANFWITAFSNPRDPVRGWNYTIDTAGPVKPICEVNAYYPKVTIITSDSKLEQDIHDFCPKEEFIIKLIPPAF